VGTTARTGLIRRLRFRAEVLRLIRRFFDSRGFLEVQTPVLTDRVIPESNLHYFTTTHRPRPESPPRALHLIPSPELWHKRLIAEGAGSLFEIARCFRDCEPAGGAHEPEFTMLEWYGVGQSTEEAMALTEELFAFVLHGLAAAGHQVPAGSFAAPFRRLSVAEAFRELAGLDLEKLQETPRFAAAVRELGVGLGDGQGAGPLQGASDGDVDAAGPRGGVGHADREGRPAWDEAFTAAFLTLVEPKLPADRPLFLTAYPRQVRCLAERVGGTPWRDRWELYAGGVELANCFSEERDPAALRGFLEEEAAALRRQRRSLPIDREMLDYMPRMPRCSGVAMGVDRLVMVLAGAKNIEDTAVFSPRF
jgi:lysyl-tRNA synthetase class 2